MTKDDEEHDPGLSRRELFRRAGWASAAAITLPAATLGCSATASRPAVGPAGRREALETLTAAEAVTLEAIVARLIPSDASGPGATEARAAHYIDRALAGALAGSREAYRIGLAAVDRQAQASRGVAFAGLSAQDQDAILTSMERNEAEGFLPDSLTFFNLVRAHTIQGTFSDPYYGGNANFVGWNLIGYPGLRLAVAAADQSLDPATAPLRQSAYDLPMFSRRPAEARGSGGPDGH